MKLVFADTTSLMVSCTDRLHLPAADNASALLIQDCWAVTCVTEDCLAMLSYVCINLYSAVYLQHTDSQTGNSRLTGKLYKHNKYHRKQFQQRVHIKTKTL